MKYSLLLLSLVFGCINAEAGFSYGAFCKAFSLSDCGGFDWNDFSNTFFKQKTQEKSQFDIHHFLATFGLNEQKANGFDIQGFLAAFPSKNQSNDKSKGQSISNFNYDDFARAMKLTDQESSKSFDIDAFNKAFDLEQKNHPEQKFDYDAFLKAFGVKTSQNVESQFNYQDFLKAFKLSSSQKSFDFDAFVKAFSRDSNSGAKGNGNSQDKGDFDFAAFQKAFESGSMHGGAVDIIQPSNARNMLRTNN